MNKSTIIGTNEHKVVLPVSMKLVSIFEVEDLCSNVSLASGPAELLR